MRKCQRCGSNDVSWMKDQTKLFGGVTASLCDACITTWDEKLLASPLWENVHRAAARREYLQCRALAQMEVTEQEMFEAIRMKHDAEQEIRPLAMEFVKTLVPESV